MAATVTKAISGVVEPNATMAPKHGPQVVDVEFVKCECCGFTEEYTLPYIARVRERYQGRWICGLCAEAVKDESRRSQRNITTDEAVKRHMKFCKQFTSSSPPTNPTEDLISAVKQLLIRTLDSPRKDLSDFRPLDGSKTCFPAMSD